MGAPAVERLPALCSSRRPLAPPADPAAAAKTVWDAYYANHQTKAAFSGLKVADMFMGGGTTIVEGSRLGMQMYGADLNPVAWFIVRNALSDVARSEVEALLADVEAEVRQQIMPFYACDCPRGHRGVWTRRSTGQEMGADFDPLALTPEQRTDYDYRGPEMIYVFWAKHGPCQVTGCGHRTPLMSSPVMAVKTLTVRAWTHRCAECRRDFDIEERYARMAPGVAQIVADGEAPSAVLAQDASIRCPHCDNHESMPSVQSRRAKRKRITLSLLVSPQWLAGAASTTKGRPCTRRQRDRYGWSDSALEPGAGRHEHTVRGAGRASRGGELPRYRREGPHR